MFIERRVAPRFPVEQDVEAVLLHGDKRLSGKIVDISQDGVRILVDPPSHPFLAELAAGARLSLIVKSDHQAFDAEVRRVGDDDLGLCFFDLASHARRRELIARIAG